jgi:hypothetical protein
VTGRAGAGKGKRWWPWRRKGRLGASKQADGGFLTPKMGPYRPNHRGNRWGPGSSRGRQKAIFDSGEQLSRSEKPFHTLDKKTTGRGGAGGPPLNTDRKDEKTT